MIKKIKDHVWQMHFIPFGSCVYLIKLKNRNILIDTSTLQNRTELLQDLKKLNLKPKNINIILLTHGHFDHVENLELFKNAEFYGGKEDFRDCNRIIDIKKLKIPEIKIIKTSGHTFGSVCFLYRDVLFSGDTLFKNGIGRTDFPNSSQDDMQNSLNMLKNLKFKFLCPGHAD